MKFFLPLVALSFASFSCNNDGCGLFQSFSGITERDQWGILRHQDADDWTLKDNWEDWERQLFDTSYDASCFPPSHFTISAYPNPTTGQFQVTFSKSAATKVDLRLIDRECHTIAAQNNLSGNGIGLQAGQIKEGIVRLYYRFIEDGCEYDGHGDILVRPADE